MPLEGHPDDCACCVRASFAPGARDRRARAAEEADLATFLPQQPPEADEADEADEAEADLINSALFQSFDAHVAKLDAARRKRIEALSFKSALEDDGEGEVNEDASLDEVDGLGVWMADDEFQGDVNFRTLQKLLTRVDQRGFERRVCANPLRRRGRPRHRRRHRAFVAPSVPPWRYPARSAQQLEFHVAFMKASARVIYRGSWETERPAIMKKHGWEKSNSEVLIRRARTSARSRAPRDSRALLCCVVCAARRAGLARRSRAPAAPTAQSPTRS